MLCNGCYLKCVVRCVLFVVVCRLFSGLSVVCCVLFVVCRCVLSVVACRVLLVV